MLRLSRQNWFQTNGLGQRKLIVDNWGIDVDPEFVNTFKLVCNDNCNDTSVSYNNCTNKVIDNNVSNSNGICNDNINVSLICLSSSSIEKN